MKKAVIILDIMGMTGGVLTLVGFPFAIYKTPLWLAVTDHSQRRYEKILRDMDAPDFAEHQKSLTRIWACVSLYFMAATWVMTYLMPQPIFVFVRAFLSLAAMLSAAVATSYAASTDPRRAAKNRARYEAVTPKPFPHQKIKDYSL